ncbi:MAG: hypothetical protein BWY61_01575 [Firmicutes bacterium ADurb.Bin354]|nr:MAG: hypothetical protein BWY61_01575 [Firmicutes bacterium ADurb.Bin354]
MTHRHRTFYVLSREGIKNFLLIFDTVPVHLAFDILRQRLVCGVHRHRDIINTPLTGFNYITQSILEYLSRVYTGDYSSRREQGVYRLSGFIPEHNIIRNYPGYSTFISVHPGYLVPDFSPLFRGQDNRCEPRSIRGINYGAFPSTGVKYRPVYNIQNNFLTDLTQLTHPVIRNPLLEYQNNRIAVHGFLSFLKNAPVVIVIEIYQGTPLLTEHLPEITFIKLVEVVYRSAVSIIMYRGKLVSCRFRYNDTVFSIISVIRIVPDLEVDSDSHLSVCGGISVLNKHLTFLYFISLFHKRFLIDSGVGGKREMSVVLEFISFPIVLFYRYDPVFDLSNNSGYR